MLGGDDVVVTKAGKKTQGLERFLSSLDGKAVAGRCVLSRSRMSVKRRTSDPALMAQQGPEPRHAPAEVCPQKSASQRGRPQGSKNQPRREVT